jgi:hypothetical protein
MVENRKVAENRSLAAESPKKFAGRNTLQKTLPRQEKVSNGRRDESHKGYAWRRFSRPLFIETSLSAQIRAFMVSKHKLWETSPPASVWTTGRHNNCKRDCQSTLGI